jgi:hypothetical protein
MATIARRGFDVRRLPEGPVASRVPNLVLCTWLFLSAFLWRHGAAQFYNTWVVAVLAFAFTLIAVGVPMVRYLNTALSIWLFISAFALSTHAGTVVNNVICALLMFVFSFVPPEGEEHAAPHEAPPPSVA